MWHKVEIVGYLGNDPEMRYMPDGTAVTNFSVATSRKFGTGEDGERQEETIWWRCSAWRNHAENINNYFEKGKPILVVGRMKPDRATGGPKMFTRQDGTVGCAYELDVYEWSFLPGGDSDGERSERSSYQTGTPAAQEEDEIPF